MNEGTTEQASATAEQASTTTHHTTEQPSTASAAPLAFTPTGPGVPVATVEPWREVTLRPKPATAAFFQLCANRHAELCAKNVDTPKAEAANFILAELLSETVNSLESDERVAQLQTEASTLREQLSTAQNERAAQPAQDLVLGLTDNEAKLIRAICTMRFKNADVRLRYKLEQAETPAQMLVNMLRNADNLYNANGNFYTGLTPASIATIK